MVSTKKALKSLWRDTLTVTEYQKVTRENMSTGFEEIVVLKNEPCKLSFSTLQSTGQSEFEAKLIQSAKLFLDGKVQIKPGSKLTVLHNGQEYVYSQSGLAGVFSCHQEIMLEPFAGWA